MAEANLVECQTCSLVYDQARIPECPRRADRRRGSAFEVLSKSRHVRRKPVTGPREEEVFRSDDGELVITTPRGFGAATSRHRELAGRGNGAAAAHAAYFVIAFLAGAVGFSLALNHAAGRPWNESPLAVVEVARPYPVVSHSTASALAARAAQSAAPTVAVAGGGQLRVTPVRFDRDSHSDTMIWTGRLGNASGEEMTEVRLTVSALDVAGREITRASFELDPGHLSVNESRPVQVSLHDDPAIVRWVVGGSWLQSRNQEVLYTADRPVAAEPGA